MDVHMPHLDGLTATMLISERCPLTVVVLMSSEDSPELRLHCRAFGAEQFIVKAELREQFPLVLKKIKNQLRTRT